MASMPRMADEDAKGPRPDKQAKAAKAAKKAKAAQKSSKPDRSHAERAMANIRAAKRGQREVSDPVGRAQLLLAEANALALLDLADAVSTRSEGG